MVQMGFMLLLYGEVTSSASWPTILILSKLPDCGVISGETGVGSNHTESQAIYFGSLP